jgi:uncharacterized lipoprotein YddW (UPF0748 family)
VAAAAVLPGLPPPAGRAPDFTGWAWVHGNRDRDRADWEERFGRLREAGVTGLLVGGGDTALLSEVAHGLGMTFHRWTWIMNRNGDAWVQEHHPEWFTVSRLGASSLTEPPYVGYYRWLCPTRPEVRAYLGDLVTGVAEEPGVDGVHLDYIRHCDVILPRGLWATYDLVQDRELPPFDFCYCEACREAFAKADGRDPMGIADPTQDEAWRRFRWDGITRVVEVLAERVHATGKEVSAAVFPTPTIARALVRQAWDEWPIDRFFPMLYHSFYEEGIAWIGQGVREGVDALGDGPRRLCAGLYLPALGPEDLARAVEEARAGGAAGVSLFEMDGLTDAHLRALYGALR